MYEWLGQERFYFYRKIILSIKQDVHDDLQSLRNQFLRLYSFNRLKINLIIVICTHTSTLEHWETQTLEGCGITL